MNVKDLPCTVKAAGPDDGLGEGEYKAIVSAFGNVDSVGDVVMPGAFTQSLKQWADRGDPIPLVWSHDWSDPFSHIGYVLAAKETDAGLEVHARLDLEDNPTAKQVYKLLKGRRVNNHSFAYDILDAAPGKHDGDSVVELRTLDILECGPCLVGANRETPVLGIKSAIPVSAGPSSTSDASWDGPANEANLATDAGAATYRKAYAWVDPDGDPDKKASFKFVHHFVSDDGTVGAASTKACTTGIGVLNGGRGGTQIPDADRQGVYNHLAAHIRAAGDEPPELKTAPTEDMITIPATALESLKTAINALAQVFGPPGPEPESPGSGAKQETGQPNSAVANDPARAPRSSAEQPQSTRSAQVAARLALIDIGRDEQQR